MFLERPRGWRKKKKVHRSGKILTLSFTGGKREAKEERMKKRSRLRRKGGVKKTKKKNKSLHWEETGICDGGGGGTAVPVTLPEEKKDVTGDEESREKGNEKIRGVEEQYQ